MLRKEGDYWLVRWDASEFRLRDAVGLHYLALLIGNPAREFLAIDLVASAREARRAPHSARFDRESSSAGGDLGPLLDRRARLAYRRRLEELRAALAEAESFNDVERAARTQGEIDALAAELARAVGLSGRERRAASPIERARVSATRAIRSALRRIRDNDAGLARHLAATVRTGTFCSYTPDPGTPVSWTL
jgi:non-specific serine/threonine protein kinase